MMWMSRSGWRAEIPAAADQPEHRHREGDTDVDRRRAFLPADILGGFGDVLQPHDHSAMQPGAGTRQFDPAMQAHEQTDPQRAFQQFDLLADRSLGHAQFLRGTGEASMPRGGFKHQQIGQPRQPLR